ncbi:MAG: hypothetical protein A2X25_06465 [Chloroflexi bacterium GWB2_49_20]|nr:MAG: hypothetical protein A2X25_06465 [Chloroflexi bacterium GWB2_49_20]OGN80315.1 MAG: hypothetical protein A2X26_08315 [Chloroflexi bacterium GWC2_49_37]OGN86045.1 MAG: hypothetical protein A2X27_00430 [Chloroflexi bacterium GWD2_49_16]HCC79344.1 hypothetical protein [Anaerolineae bacterium]HCM96435.1 hypothetical protein [Anaerolineae bacterium]
MPKDDQKCLFNCKGAEQLTAPSRDHWRSCARIGDGRIPQKDGGIFGMTAPSPELRAGNADLHNPGTLIQRLALMVPSPREPLELYPPQGTKPTMIILAHMF